jgi:hypothetical protein
MRRQTRSARGVLGEIALALRRAPIVDCQRQVTARRWRRSFESTRRRR